MIVTNIIRVYYSTDHQIDKKIQEIVFTLDHHGPRGLTSLYHILPANPFTTLSNQTSKDDKVRNLSLMSILV